MDNKSKLATGIGIGLSILVGTLISKKIPKKVTSPVVKTLEKTVEKQMPAAESMLVLGINRVLDWVQITTGGRTYTCPTKEINGELFFKFKKNWHKVMEYTSELTTEFFSKGGKYLSKRITK